MSNLSICTFPRDEVLRRKATRIPGIDRYVRKLADSMVDTMDYYHGVGLAAPQVGVSLRLIVVQLPGEEPVLLVNPEITETAGVQEVTEGCLSIPEYYGELVRPAEVTVKGKDLSGKTVKIKADGLFAQALQHEIDHLNGVLYIDHLTSPGKIHKLQADTAGQTLEAHK